jgi:hypothetical protein
MDVEREALVKFGVPVVATAAFIVMVLAVGLVYGVPQSNDGVALSETGAIALVALLGAFVVAMGALGALVGAPGEDED